MLRISRRGLLVTVAASLAGCQRRERHAGDNPVFGAATQQGSLALESPSFADGEPIPRSDTRDGQDRNPPLRIRGHPDDGAAFVLVVDDADATNDAGQPWLHWLVWNIGPARRRIPAGWSPAEADVGRNDFGERAYGGPDPPSGTHTYRFKLSALDRRLELSASATRVEVGEAMAGSILARTQLTGTVAA